jgi:hypothetical protein
MSASRKLESNPPTYIHPPDNAGLQVRDLLDELGVIRACGARECKIQMDDPESAFEHLKGSRRNSSEGYF